MGWLTRMTATDHDWSATIARVTLGLVMFPHGAQKAFGWFGGYGAEATLGYLGSMGIPPLVGWLVIAAEVFGGLGLVFGLLGRVAAGGIIPVMVGAVALTHWPNGFFMDWGGAMPGEGYEYHLLAIALSLVVVIRGSGAFSLDHWLSRQPARVPVRGLATNQ